MNHDGSRYVVDAVDFSRGSILAVALACLSPLAATVILLHSESRLSFEQISQMIGISVGSVRKAWVRGLQELAFTSRDDLAEVA
jgi:DNA-directed RNA polymerase specialized sigma24 family protein